MTIMLRYVLPNVFSPGRGLRHDADGTDDRRRLRPELSSGSACSRRPRTGARWSRRAVSCCAVRRMSRSCRAAPFSSCRSRSTSSATASATLSIRERSGDERRPPRSPCRICVRVSAARPRGGTVRGWRQLFAAARPNHGAGRRIRLRKIGDGALDHAADRAAWPHRRRVR